MQSADVCDAWEEVQGLVKERGFSLFFLGGGPLCDLIGICVHRFLCFCFLFIPLDPYMV